MSRTIKVQRFQSPVQAFLSINGKTGSIGAIYPGTKNPDILPVETPFNFVVLDCDSRKITGKDSQKKNAKKYNSNTVHPNYTENEFFVSKGDSNDVIASGKWSDIKDKLPGARSSQMLYGIWQHQIEGELHYTMFRLSLHGRALSAWINFTKDTDIFGAVIFTIAGFETVKGGENDTVSQVPVFSASILENVDPLILAADDADTILQAYFADIFNKSLPENERDADEPEEDDHEEAVDAEIKAASTEDAKPKKAGGDDLPF